jgi:hypothetical protein
VSTKSGELQTVENIYTQDGKFVRLRKGYKIFNQAMTVRPLYPYDRVHQFVRSLEGLIVPGINRTKRDFMHRCQVFCLPSEPARQLLGKLYELRSRVEHLTEWNDLFSGEDKERQIMIQERMARQVEELARHTFTQILVLPGVLQHFETQQRLNDFWKLRDDERGQVFSNRLDFTGVR